MRTESLTYFGRRGSRKEVPSHSARILRGSKSGMLLGLALRARVCVCVWNEEDTLFFPPPVKSFTQQMWFRKLTFPYWSEMPPLS